MDIDVWEIYNKEKVEDFKKAILESGFLYDPDEYTELEEPYIQIVNYDFVHMSVDNTWDKNSKVLWKSKKLTILNPPLEIIAASKLAAGRDRDLDDVDFLFDIDNDLDNKIKNILFSFSEEDQENIEVI